MVEQHYRWDFIGLSTDTKPTPSTSEKVVDGSTFYTSDNSKLYVWYKDQWYEKTATGGGGGGGDTPAVGLTTSDYDYPTNNPDGIALWTLPKGKYFIDTNDAVRLYTDKEHFITSDNTYIISVIETPYDNTTLVEIDRVQVYGDIIDYYVKTSDGTLLAKHEYLTGANVINNLTSYVTQQPLSANQGRVLKGYFDAILTETFTFTLTDGTTVTKNICYKAS